MLDVSLPAPCSLPRVDGYNLSWIDFNAQGYRHRPVIISGFNESRQSVSSLLSLAAFRSRFASHRLQVGNGRNRESKRQHVILRLHEYLDASSSTRQRGSIFLTDLLTPLHREMFKSVFVPPLLADFIARPILSIGVNGTGEDFHSHDETWFLLLHGKKAWWIADRGKLQHLLEWEPCQLLGRAPPHGVTFCVQQAGEVVSFGNHAHATCNLEEFQVGVGAQGHTEHWPHIVRESHRGDEVAMLKKYAFKDGADFASVASTAETARGRTALHQNSLWGHVAVAELLISKGVDPAAVDTDGTQAVDLAAMAGHLPLTKTLCASYGFAAKAYLSRAIRFAAMHGHVEIVQYAIDQDARMRDHRDVSGSEPLHFASKAGHVEMVKFLMGARADIVSSSEEHLTPLHFASSMGHMPLIKLLVRVRASPTMKSGAGGMTPVHMAVRFGHVPALKSLIKLSGMERLKPGLLHFAAEGGQIPIVDFLLASGANPNAPDERGFQPLHVAALNGRSFGVAHLLMARAWPHAADRSGFTAMHFAAKGSHLEVMRMLAQNRANVNVQSKDGFTPAAVAQRLGHQSAMAYLTQIKRSSGGSEL